MYAATSDHAEARGPSLVKTEDRVVRGREAEALTGLENMQRTRLEGAGLFPRRFKLNPAGGPRGSYGYSYREIMDWIETRRASRGTAA